MSRKAEARIAGLAGFLLTSAAIIAVNLIH